jgi:hypothetical protein
VNPKSDLDAVWSAESLRASPAHAGEGEVVGFGTEGKLLIPGWTLKSEALYMDLGTLDTTGVTSSSCTPHVGSNVGCGTPGFLNGGQVTTHTHFTDTIPSRRAELSIPLI